MNRELAELYAKFFSNLKEADFDLTLFQPPLLLDADNNPYGYNDTPRGHKQALNLQPWNQVSRAVEHLRLMVVGQETFGWEWNRACLKMHWDYPENAWPFPDIQSFHDVLQTSGGVSAGVNLMMKATSVFCFSAYQSKNHNSPFWRFARALVKRSERSVSLLWTNLVKIVPNSSPYQIVFPWHSNIERKRGTARYLQRHLIREEIRITQPNLIVFTTGPHYDEILLEALDAKLVQIDSIPARQIAAVVSKEFNSLPMIRTYHPGYALRQSRLRDTYFEVIDKLMAKAGVALSVV